MDILPPILLQVFLIMLSAFFTTAKVAVVSVNDNKLASLKAKGDKKACRIAKLTEKPSRFLTVIRSATMFCCVLSGACAAYSFGTRLAHGIYRWKPVWFTTLLRYQLLLYAAITVSVIFFAFLMYVFGYALPKGIAAKKADDLALKLSWLILPVIRLATPFALIESGISAGLLRIFGGNSHEEEEKVTEEEIRIMVDVGTEKGAIDESEKEIIQNVFEFDDLSAGDVATHRTDITMLWLEESDEKWDEIITGTSFSRYPVCDESADKIVGVLSTRDYLTLEDKSRETVMAEAVRPAYFVPESVKADVLFKNMKEKKEFFAVVLDEYGGTAGIVTINDLLERLVGEFNTNEDEEMDDEPLILQAEESKWIIRGEATMEEVREVLGDAIEEDAEADTFSGYVLGLYGSVPTDGSTFEVETPTMSIRVLSVLDHMAERCEVLLRSDEPEDPADPEKKQTV
ncbi:MAG: HlyC/CorC family transporter [Clostridia bacterium]|nr:HlyC/CorC family transporter [Clostridia bacterium]